MGVGLLRVYLSFLCYVRCDITQVQAASSAEELKSLMHEDEFDFRFRCGYNKPTSHMDLSDRDEFIRAVWLHYVLFQPYAELQQLRNGLKDTLQLELLLTLYPEEMWNPFATTNAYDVTVDYLLDSFTIQYSDQGSNKRSLEESIVYMWSQYITECEGIALYTPSHFIVMHGMTAVYMYILGVNQQFLFLLFQEAARPHYLTFFSSSLEPTNCQLLGLIKLL